MLCIYTAGMTTRPGCYINLHDAAYVLHHCNPATACHICIRLNKYAHTNMGKHALAANEDLQVPADGKEEGVLCTPAIRQNAWRRKACTPWSYEELEQPLKPNGHTAACVFRGTKQLHVLCTATSSAVLTNLAISKVPRRHAAFVLQIAYRTCNNSD